MGSLRLRFSWRIGVTGLRGMFVVVVGFAVVAGASHVAAQRNETTTITRLYTGADGKSHADETEVAWRPAKLRAELKESESVNVTGAQFLRWPRGFTKKAGGSALRWTARWALPTSSRRCAMCEP